MSMITQAVILAALCLRSVSAQTPFDWTTIQPSDQLNWVSCYEPPFQCTRLTAPRNYSNPNAGTVAIALIRLPSSSAGTPSYKGPLLFNPGGPGGSGTEFVHAFGPIATSFVGPDFDLVGFDPRGVGQTTPKVSVFKDAAEQNSLWVGSGSGDLDFRTDIVENQWAWMQVLGRLAQDRDKEGILAHVTTDNVARDMLSIVNAHGQEKLNYWGISYGSVLGSVFSTLFPDKVGKVILDGIVNFKGYYACDRGNEPADAEKTLRHFLDECHKAGADHCPFFEKSRPAMTRKLDQLFESVKKQPLPVYSPSLPTYGTVSLPILKGTVFAALYSPLATYQTLAAALQDLSRGNATLVWASAIGTTEPGSADATIAIDCADAVPITETAQELRRYAKRIDHVSRFQGLVGVVRLFCSGWRIHPNAFRGPAGGNTSFPILFIGNTADPITPLSNARVSSKLFPGSVVLTQDTPGHSSISAPTECTLAAIYAYLNEGTLPKKGTVCAFSGPYFGTAASNAASVTVQRRNGEHGRFVDAADQLRSLMREHPQLVKGM